MKSNLIPIGRRRRGHALLTLAIFCLASFAAAQPFVPRDESQILEKVRPGNRVREVRPATSATSANVPSLDDALRAATESIQRARAEADPRYLGHAEAALRPWLTRTHPPPAALVLRATLRQSRHEFQPALADLDAALAADPDNAQAWLTRGTIHQVQGRYDEARRSFAHLAGRVSELVAVTASSSLGSLTGDAEKSYSALNAALRRARSSSTEERIWALTVLGEIATRRGHAADAERHFRGALLFSPSDTYLLAAWSDHLLDQGRAAEVPPLLQDWTRVDGLLLRLALAERALAPGASALHPHIGMLRARFEASRQRGDDVHQREEARFQLHLLDQPIEALRLARENWKLQREPADARILLEAAAAANQAEAARPALDWLRTHHVEDVKLTALAARLDPGFNSPKP